jgi:hypothetical protein
MQRRRATKTCISGLLRGRWACLAALLSAGCSTPQPFHRGDAIPIGPVQLIVSGVTVSTAPDRARFVPHGLRKPTPAPPESMIRVEVSIRCSGSNRFVRMDLNERMYDREAVTLQDSTGGSYSALGLLDPSDSQNWENWLARFEVPRNRKDFTLIIKNVDRAPGQPTAVAVPLGEVTVRCAPARDPARGSASSRVWSRSRCRRRAISATGCCSIWIHLIRTFSAAMLAMLLWGCFCTQFHSCAAQASCWEFRQDRSGRHGSGCPLQSFREFHFCCS